MKRKEIEEEISNFWEKNNFFERSVEERPEDKQYVFYDGPPFATGLPHHGHILGLTAKDVFPRYWTMKGHRVERKWGWDCHGLPIENIVEKDLGLKNKHEIEEMGIEKFNEAARAKVLYFADEWKKTVKILGKWIDMDNAYKTMDQSYMESVWSIFKNLYDKEYVFEGKKVLMYCPRCQTPLANSEIQMDNSYKEVTEKTATVALKLKDSDEYLLVWTTTPWTLIGNVAVAINPEMDYVKVDVFGKKFIVAKELADKNFNEYKILEEFKGKEILNLEYAPLYKVDTEGKKGYYVIDGEKEVTEEEGTGLVHMAIYGEFDYEMIKKYNLPIIQHVNNEGKLVMGPEEWKGKWFKNVDKDVLEDLYNRGILINSKDYTHSYPFCYRCGTPLIYNAVDSWFIDIQKIKDKLKENSKEINWYPDSMKTRFDYILENAPDWNISRNRYWATAIPIWRCSCGEIKVIGSIKELKENAIEEVSDDIDLHKHVVDKIHLKCSCGNEMSRIPEVIDCWFESGSMPFASKHYPFENKDWMENNYPADFISEYTAQVRAWFYYMHVLGTFMKDKAPFKNVVVSGTILASDGSKMSKSKGNFTPPKEIFEKYGADSLRFYLMSSQLMRAQDLNFIEDNVKEVYRQLIMILSNVNNFYKLFGKDNSEFDDDFSKNPLDRWLISKVHKLVKDVTEKMDDYNTTESCSELSSFVEDLSTWYVRRSRDRFKSTDEKERNNSIHTLAFALDKISKLLAPITPFLAEETFQNVRNFNYEKDVSVHLEDWPSFDDSKINASLEKEMDLVREIVSRGLDERINVKIAVKQPLSKLTIKGAEISEELQFLIKEELNVKEVLFEKGEEISLEYNTVLNDELKQEGLLREIIRSVNSLRKKENLTINDKILLEIYSDDELVKKAIDNFQSELSSSIQAEEVSFTPNEGKEFNLTNANVKIDFKKI